MRVIDTRGGPPPIIDRDAADEPIDAVRAIVADVRARGDAALFDLTARLDGVRLEALRVTSEELDEAAAIVPAELKDAIEEASNRISFFARRQLLEPWEDEIGGSRVGEIVTPIARAGAYIPGGRASYPSTVLMTIIPARLAGVTETVVCVPPAPDGSVPAATLAAASHAGVGEIYKVGGAQAVAAMAFGTESIEKVDFIAGPGNIFVATAKREVAGHVAIDSIAGPSEIAIVADGTANPTLIAWDLIAQAEHGPGGTFLLVTFDDHLAREVERELERLMADSRVSEDVRRWMDAGTKLIVVDDFESAVRVVDDFAPEHLELHLADAALFPPRFGRAGAIFVGTNSPVSVGDYLAGSNHVLPTGGTARWASGLRASSFQKATAVIEHTRESLYRVRENIQSFAETERLPLHSLAVEARFERGDA